MENNKSERSTFSQLSNILTLLYSLDKDTNPDNGIEIAQRAQELFSTTSGSIDFKEDYLEFENPISELNKPYSKNWMLPSIFYQLSDQKTTGGNNPLKPGRALDYFYEALNIQSNFFILDTSNYYAYADDGKVESSHTLNFIYDTNDNRLNISRESNQTVMSCYDIYLYDNKDNLLSYKSNYIDYCYQDRESTSGLTNQTYTYSQQDNILKASSISGDSRGESRASNTKIDYDGKGRLIKKQVDSNVSGPTEIETNQSDHKYFYDLKNNLTNTEHYDETEEYGNTFYEYNNYNNIISISSSTSDNNSFEKYTYDSNGNKLSYSNDRNGDGEFEDLEKYTYNSNGKLLSAFFQDNRRSETYTYDSNGNLLSHSFATSTFSQLTFFQLTTYTYDADGNLLIEKIDYYDSINFDSIDETRSGRTNTYSYDINGNRLTAALDYGHVKHLSTYTYDDRGNRLSRTREDYENDKLDASSESRYVYDDDNNLISTRYSRLYQYGRPVNDDKKAEFVWQRANWRNMLLRHEASPASSRLDPMSYVPENWHW